MTGEYMLVVAKIDNSKGLVITAFYTDKIKKGATRWSCKGNCYPEFQEKDKRKDGSYRPPFEHPIRSSRNLIATSVKR